eukprot:m.232430 g.232430  ORF g.232430 m.232430 type:complete len:124 (+) comp15714_c0_seq1:971-1342(+)
MQIGVMCGFGAVCYQFFMFNVLTVRACSGLRFADNEITSIPINFFSGLFSVQRILFDMRRNRIRELSPFFGEGPLYPYTVEADLSFNNVSILPHNFLSYSDPNSTGTGARCGVSHPSNLCPQK